LGGSNDAIHYREPVRNALMVPHGGADDWDSEGIMQANGFANTDTQTSFGTAIGYEPADGDADGFGAPVGNEHRKSGQHRPAHAAARRFWLLRQAAHVYGQSDSPERWPITWLSAMPSCLTNH